MEYANHVSVDSRVIYIVYTGPKNETSASHLCEFSTNESSYFIQVFCFKKCDYLTILCAKKEIHSMHIYGNDNPASTSTQLTKVT